jgi:hypothetical protein
MLLAVEVFFRRFKHQWGVLFDFGRGQRAVGRRAATETDPSACPFVVLLMLLDTIEYVFTWGTTVGTVSKSDWVVVRVVASAEEEGRNDPNVFFGIFWILNFYLFSRGRLDSGSVLKEDVLRRVAVSDPVEIDTGRVGVCRRGVGLCRGDSCVDERFAGWAIEGCGFREVASPIRGNRGRGVFHRFDELEASSIARYIISVFECGRC